jgi:hypothetical protein
VPNVDALVLNVSLPPALKYAARAVALAKVTVNSCSICVGRLAAFPHEVVRVLLNAAEGEKFLLENLNEQEYNY